MFRHLSETKYPPQEKPIMVFDGKCGFCKYWVIKWKLMTLDKMDYKPFQEVAKDFPDIEEKNFAEAVRCILPNGKIYSGPAAAYYTGFFIDKNAFLFSWYQNNRLFRFINDQVYQWIADHRDFTFRVCLRVLGKNPKKSPVNRLLAIFLSFVVIMVAIFYLANI